MPVSTRLAALALAGAASFLVVGCSSSSDSSSTTTAASSTSASGGASTTAASDGTTDTGSSSGDVSATATLTGDVTFDGAVPGRIVCFHDDSAKRLEFESQGDPRINIVVNDNADGDLTLLDQYKVMTGQASYPTSGPKVEALTIEAEDGNGQYLATSGTLTIEDKGASGTIEGDFAVAGGVGQPVHATIAWKDCPAA